jgi:hypothetical protein
MQTFTGVQQILLPVSSPVMVQVSGVVQLPQLPNPRSEKTESCERKMPRHLYVSLCVF